MNDELGNPHNADDLDTPKGLPKKNELETPFIIQLLVTAFSFWAIIHTILTRSIDDVFRYTLYTAIPIALIVIIVGLTYIRKSGLTKSSAGNKVIILVLPVLIIFVALIYYSLGASIKDLFFWIQAPSLSKNGTIITTLLITLALGFLLFYFRLRLRGVYGITEVLIGLAIAANRVAIENTREVPKSEFYLAILTASVYLVVRGIDNIHQGLTKDPFDPVAQKIFFYFKKMSDRYS